MTLTIASLASSIKFLFNINYKSSLYSSIYVTVLSIQDSIDDTICNNNDLLKGELNGFSYKAQCSLVTTKRNYSTGLDADDKAGNVGTNIISLFKVNLTLTKGQNLEKTYSYYITRVKSL